MQHEGKKALLPYITLYNCTGNRVGGGVENGVQAALASSVLSPLLLFLCQDAPLSGCSQASSEPEGGAPLVGPVPKRA